tara:strand:+ start:318 stop:656 length:339 start_codon:yes stop_codon:yes gene_type:complete
MKLLAAMGLFFIGQTLIWFQTNGQFINTWAKHHPFLMACIFSLPISYSFIHATRLTVDYYDGLLWPGRLIGFACGMISFYLITYYMMGEGLTLKTTLTLVLAAIIILIQVFL